MARGGWKMSLGGAEYSRITCKPAKAVFIVGKEIGLASSTALTWADKAAPKAWLP